MWVYCGICLKKIKISYAFTLYRLNYHVKSVVHIEYQSKTQAEIYFGKSFMHFKK